MGIISSLFNPQASLTNDIRQALMGGGGNSSSGASVTPETALRQSAVYACTSVLSQDVAQLPAILYRRTYKNGHEGRERASDHQNYKLLKLSPNRVQTSFGFREMLTAHNALRGNSFAFINRVGRGEVKELLPIHPDRVEVKLSNDWDVSYIVQDNSGSSKTYDSTQILHICGMTLNGYSGVSPITYARETIGLSLATEKFGAQLFKNGAKMGGILKYAKSFKDADTGRKVADSFDERTNGDNAHRTILLEDGLEWEKITMTSEDSQFLETRQFQIPEIARFYRMPLHKIQDLTRSTFSNIEHQAIEYVVSTLGPWLVRWEQTLNKALLLEQEQEEYYFEFMVDGLLRGDIKSRYEAYSRGILAGFLNRNEVRSKENMDWVENLDEFIFPMNMAIAGTEPGPAGGNNAA